MDVSVGARVAGMGREGLYGRPRSPAALAPTDTSELISFPRAEINACRLVQLIS